MSDVIKRFDRLAMLPTRWIEVSGIFHTVPKNISRGEKQGGWRVSVGPSGVFVPGAVGKWFSDRGSAADSLLEAMDYLNSIYLCPAARPTSHAKGNRKAFMPAGMKLKLRRPAYRAKNPGTWVIVLSPLNEAWMNEKREYVVIGMDGAITQADFVSAMRAAISLRAARLMNRARVHAESRGVALDAQSLKRPVGSLALLMQG